MSSRVREQLSFLDDDPRGASPVRRQYLEFKRRYPDCVLLFRLGDFFETFDDDARLVAAALDLTLTQRDLGRGARVPMAGIPAHAAESYIARLLAQGHRVAICDQVGPVPERGLVRREVVRVVTPGTLVEPSLLAAEANNYLASLWRAPTGAVGLAYADISTGELAATALAGDDVLDALAAELARLAPAELLLAQDADDAALRAVVPERCRLTPCPPERFHPERARRAVLEHFAAPSLAALGLGDPAAGARGDGPHPAVPALGALLAYLRDTQAAALALLDRVQVYAASGAMVLDAATRRNLELLEGARSGARADSLLGVLDHTRTPMGARLLRAWISQPLRDLARLQRRQAAVAALVDAPLRRAELRALLGQAGDLERLAGRAAQRLLGPRECLALRRGLEVVPAVRALLADPALAPLHPAAEQLDPCAAASAAIARTLADDPPAVFGEGTIRAGVSAALDECRALSGDTKQVLAQLERRERERTGVRSLKIGYNRVFGYYLEVSHAVANSPTDHFQRAQCGAATVAELLDKLGYQRKQTLANAERYVTPELKTLEARLQSAQEEALELERQLYQGLLDTLAAAAPALRRTATALARLDVLAALAEAAARYGYVRPELLAEGPLEIEQGRHPVVERRLPAGSFVPNDTRLDHHDCQIVILTGPNMAGKSTYLRQVALIVLMAQIGSFVPAARARLGLVDRIFTRVGAQDDIASGHSTFMVEMVETAAILRAATRQSLVILDEVGRGTSTFDGMAIARAVVEYLHDHPRLGARTLFATHYHELAELERTRPRVKAYRMAVLEEGERVVFEHRVEPGGADRSYGVHVARLAGLPPAVTRRAAELVRELEQRGPLGAAPEPAPTANGRAPEGTLHPVLAELRRLDVLALSPLEALAKLLDLQERARES
ncbi:MAG TPA: DNA mismatch repair protein MutS [Chloroflexota bacterium]|nr:DNA mismatch repair protein MutS [Chloroflexota bacterium]